LRLLQGAVGEAKRAGVPETQGRIVGGLGEVYRLLGDFPKAEKLHRESLARARRKGNPRWEGIALIQLAADLVRTGRPSEALPLLNRALALAEQAGEKPSVAHALLEMAKAFLALGQPEEALEAASSSLTIAREMGVRWLIVEGVVVKGKAFLASGRGEEAKTCLEEALRVAYEAQLVLLRWQVELALGTLLMEQGRPDEGRAYLRGAVKAVEKIRSGLEDEEMQRCFWEREEVKGLYAILGCVEAPFDARRIWLRLASPKAPLGRPLRDEEYVEVLWTVDAGDEDEEVRRREGKVALRRRRILRLLEEAEAQGGAPTEYDLAAALDVTARTIRSDIAALRREGYRIATRGTMKRMPA
jgi:tetratricopeptide (TPR) repeat protein